MIQTAREILLILIMLSILFSLSLILDNMLLVLSEEECRQAKLAAERIRELASSLGLNADEYAERVASCGR